MDFDDISGKSLEEVREDFNENPTAFMANYGRQVRHEIMGEVKTLMSKEREAQVAQSQVDRILQTYQQYAKDNEDFDGMWNSGELQAYMDKNPGHSSISAHQMLSVEKRSGDTKTVIEEAVTKAVKETEAKMTKNFLAKRGNTVLGEGPSGGADSSNETDEVGLILKNPKQFGGTVMAGVKALEARERLRAQAGG